MDALYAIWQQAILTYLFRSYKAKVNVCVSLGVNCSHYQLGETKAVKAHSVQAPEKAGADANVLAR